MPTTPDTLWLHALLAGYCLLIVLASLVGGWLPVLFRVTHTRMQAAMSAVGGLMLGVGLLHLLPHAIIKTNSLDWAFGSALVGLLATFLLIRMFHIHGHGHHDHPLPETEPDEPHHAGHGDCGHHDDVGSAELTAHPIADGDGRAANPEPLGHVQHAPGHGHAHRLSWLGLFFGLALHTLIDGVALAASVHGMDVAPIGLLGLGTFLTVLLHKPLDSLSITAVMSAAGWRRGQINGVNGAFAMMCPAGAVLFVSGAQAFAAAQSLIVGCALGFSAGVFLCIALADILPEVQFHQHDRGKLFATLLSGVVVAYLIGLAEHGHSHQLPGAAEHAEHDGHVHSTNATDGRHPTDHDHQPAGHSRADKSEN